MENIAVRLVDLQPMHVVSATGYGQYPETEAWDLILDFTNERRIDPWDKTHRFFGFNNPDPSPETPEYGYEQWMTVDDGVAAHAPLDAKDVSGGLYATVHIRGLDTIGDAWQHLAGWCDEHGYAVAHDREPCLEELLTPIDTPTEDWEMDLYLAVDKP